MGFTPMKFDRVWTSAIDFPTYEPHEETVRADMQYLFDSIKDQFNSFTANELVAANVPFNPYGAFTSRTVQEAIEDVIDNLSAAYEGSIVDGSVTAEKLHQVTGEEAVITLAIRDGAVTTAKIADGAVTAAKLDPGAIDEYAIGDGAIQLRHMAPDSVDETQLVDYCVTHTKIRNGAVHSNNIENREVIRSKIALKAISDEELDDLAVKTGKIDNGAVTAAKIGSSAVTSAKLHSGAVTTTKIDDGAVTYTKTTGIQKKHIPTTVTLESGETSWTVSVEGVTADNTIICSGDAVSDETSFEQWVANGIHCVGQGDGTLEFVASTAPTVDVSVCVLIMDI